MTAEGPAGQHQPPIRIFVPLAQALSHAIGPDAASIRSPSVFEDRARSADAALAIREVLRKKPFPVDSVFLGARPFDLHHAERLWADIAGEAPGIAAPRWRARFTRSSSQCGYFSGLEYVFAAWEPEARGCLVGTPATSRCVVIGSGSRALGGCRAGEAARLEQLQHARQRHQDGPAAAASGLPAPGWSRTVIRPDDDRASGLTLRDVT